MLYLYPADGHPKGASNEASFILLTNSIFPFQADRAEPAISWYKKLGSLIFPTPAHPEVLPPHDKPHFKIDGNLFYPLDGHPHGRSNMPWFQIKDKNGLAVFL